MRLRHTSSGGSHAARIYLRLPAVPHGASTPIRTQDRMAHRCAQVEFLMNVYQAINAVQALTCTKCAQAKHVDHFPPDQRKLSGRSSLCKSCHQAASVAWQAANAGKVNETRRARYERKKMAGELPPRKYDSAKARERGRYKRYGVTSAKYLQMLAQQDGRCAICQRPSSDFARPLAVDHDHTCCAATPTCGKCNRGLLCGGCNTALHSVERDDKWLSRAANYIRKNT